MSPTTTATPRELDDRDLPALIARADGPVVVESYFAGWEAPWRAFQAGDWSELREGLDARARCAVLETGRSRSFAVRHGLEIVPEVLVFLRGEVVARFTGRVRAAEVLAAVRGALERERTVASALRELEALPDAQERHSPLRSVLRRRSATASEPALVRAG